MYYDFEFRIIIVQKRYCKNRGAQALHALYYLHEVRRGGLLFHPYLGLRRLTRAYSALFEVPAFYVNLRCLTRSTGALTRNKYTGYFFYAQVTKIKGLCAKVE